MPLRDVAKQTGISASTLSRVERMEGYQLRMDTFLKLCDWLEVSPCDLIEVQHKGDDPEISIDLSTISGDLAAYLLKKTIEEDGRVEIPSLGIVITGTE